MTPPVDRHDEIYKHSVDAFIASNGENGTVHVFEEELIRVLRGVTPHVGLDFEWGAATWTIVKHCNSPGALCWQVATHERIAMQVAARIRR